jgi:microcompartment protein CcmK/EutM
MQLARVVGTVVAAQKSDRLDGLKLLIIQPVDPHGKPIGGYRVAADAVGVGIDEIVLFATGSSARQTEATQNRPTDAVIMAVVETIEIEGVPTYHKADTAPAAGEAADQAQSAFEGGAR